MVDGRRLAFFVSTLAFLALKPPRSGMASNAFKNAQTRDVYTARRTDAVDGVANRTIARWRNTAMLRYLTYHHSTAFYISYDIHSDTN